MLYNPLPTVVGIFATIPTLPPSFVPPATAAVFVSFRFVLPKIFLNLLVGHCVSLGFVTFSFNDHCFSFTAFGVSSLFGLVFFDMDLEACRSNGRSSCFEVCRPASNVSLVCDLFDIVASILNRPRSEILEFLSIHNVCLPSGAFASDEVKALITHIVLGRCHLSGRR